MKFWYAADNNVGQLSRLFVSTCLERGRVRMVWRSLGPKSHWLASWMPRFVGTGCQTSASFAIFPTTAQTSAATTLLWIYDYTNSLL